VEAAGYDRVVAATMNPFIVLYIKADGVFEVEKAYEFDVDVDAYLSHLVLAHSPSEIYSAFTY